MENINTVPVTCGIPALHDPKSGNVFIVLGEWLFAAGNAQSGDIYRFRQMRHKAGEDLVVPTQFPVGWKIDLEGGSVEQSVSRVIAWFFMLNMGLAQVEIPLAALNVGSFLHAVTEVHLPEMVEEKCTVMTAMMRAAMAVIEAKQGRLSMQEMTREAERLIALVSVQPHAELARPIALKDAPNVGALHLVDPAGRPV